MDRDERGELPRSRRKGRSARLLGCEDCLRDWIAQRQEITLAEKLRSEKKLNASASTIRRFLRSSRKGRPEAVDISEV